MDQIHQIIRTVLYTILILISFCCKQQKELSESEIFLSIIPEMEDSLKLECTEAMKAYKYSYNKRAKKNLKWYLKEHSSYILSKIDSSDFDIIKQLVNNYDKDTVSNRNIIKTDTGLMYSKEELKRGYGLYDASFIKLKKGRGVLYFEIRAANLCSNSGGGFFFFSQNEEGKWHVDRFIREWAAKPWG